MIKHFAKIFIHIVLVGIGIGFVCGILNLLIISAIKNRIAIVIINGVLSAVATFILFAILSTQSSFAEQFFEDEGEMDYWRYARNSNKKVSPIKVFLAILPLLAGAVCIFLFGLKNVAEINLGNGKVGFNSSEVRAVFGIVSAEGVYLMIAWLFLAAHYIRWTHCNSVHGFKYVKSTDYNSGTYEQTKTKDYNETVGTVYLKDKKIGTVSRAKTATYKRDVNWSNETKCYKCIFCGKEKKVRTGTSSYGNWK